VKLLFVTGAEEGGEEEGGHKEEWIRRDHIV